jgi:hypothetical protein
MAGFTILLKVQVICARTRMLVAGIVSTLPDNIPKLPAGLPDATAFASEQLAEVIVKLEVAASVMVTAVPLVTARIGVGDEGEGVPADDVVIAAGFDARFVAVKVNGPPAEPSVVLRTATVAAFAVFTLFVMTHVIFAPARTLAAGMVTTLPASVPKLAGFPVMAEFASVQVTDVGVKLVAGASVMVTAVLNAVTFRFVGIVGVAVLVCVVVIEAGAEARLVAVNVKGPPIAPDVIFCTATVAGLAVLVKTQASESP